MTVNRAFLGLEDVALEGERLEAWAKELAVRAFGRTRHPRFAEALNPSGDRRAILQSYKQLCACAQEEAELPPAAEAMLDSFYVVEKSLVALTNDAEQLRSRRLPVNREGEHVGLARVYSVAAGLVGHHSARIDESALARYLEAFQQVSPLSMGELCALPVMLRLCIVRVVRLISDASLRCAQEQQRAKELAGALCRASGEERRVNALLSRAGLHSRPACVERLMTILHERDEYRLIEQVNAALRMEDADAEALAARDRRMQAERAKRMRNAIASLRFLDSLDFRAFFERFSVVEAALQEDAVYPNMDAQTRGYYRAAVERLARQLSVAETVVAKTAVRLAAEGEGRLGHVGAYLLEEGEPMLREALRPDKRYIRLGEKQKLMLFAAVEGAIALFLLALAALWGGWLPCLLSAIPAWSLGRFLAVRLFMWGRPPRRIPRMALQEGVPADSRTLVVVPTLILSEKDVESALAQLRTHYLANMLTNCCFAVLGDFKDSPEEKLPGEEALLQSAKRQTEALNARYAQNGEPIFFFLHRRRELSPYDGIYMGRERKRGALCDLVELISAGEEGPFALITSPLPKGIRYCMTLDGDTMLPPGALIKCIGAMEHPLNRPVADENGVVQQGHGLIAPRMRQTLTSAAKTLFARLISGESGVDLYASAASEFYQDVFGTGNFGGKGIFDISAFRAALKYWIPDNAVLSHDLLEGCFLRAGFMGDVALYDGEPASFAAWWKRQHRWMRGDWQLLPFLLPKLNDAAATPHETPLSLLARAKMLDNLRRTLLAPAVMLMLAFLPYLGGGAYILIGLAALWDGFLWDMIFLICSLAFRSTRGRDAWGAVKERAQAALRSVMELVTLPYAAYKNGDAIARSLWRVLVSHRNMLEWQTAAESAGAKKDSLLGTGKLLWPCLLGEIFMAVSALLGHMPAVSILFAALFLFAPLLVWRLDRPCKEPTLPNGMREDVLRWAKQTWRFFETFCTAENNYLPPDNYQETPLGTQVRNTSPTNIGMALLSTVAAHALGLIDEDNMLSRLDGIATSLERMDKWNGHLYNWYSVASLAPLEPRYVSTVDSGNLAACLLTCESALETLHTPAGDALGKRLRALGEGMDFRALYDEGKKLFYIGFDCTAGALTKSWYDLLASEARLTSFMAVALHQVDDEHWQSLSRLLVDADGSRALISWSGTMFEYLMPVLLTGMVPGSLLGESCLGAVRAQRAAVPEDVPWGISESGYYAFDRTMYYQYRAFGVHALALCPAREKERVIAPYASMLALMADPEGAVENLARLEDMGALGQYGFYEALDFTPQRLREGVPFETVKSYMAHHQGMGFCAAANALTGGALAAYFHRVPEVRAASLLLSEKRPSLALAIRAFHGGISPKAQRPPRREGKPRIVTQCGAVPETQLLTNGRYTVFLTDGGLSMSRCDDLMLTRFRPDALRSDSGIHFLLRDGAKVWSLTQAPVNGAAEAYCVTLEPHKVTYERRNNGISSRLSVCVSPRHDGEVRHLTLKNDGHAPCTLELGVFAEIALAKQEEDLAHPAFVKLTVDAKLKDDVLLFERRGQGGRWAYACLFGPGKVRYATDRLSYLGRNKTYASAMCQPMPVPETVSAPIEPGMCARTDITLGPGETVEYTLIFGAAENERHALAEAEAMRSEGLEAFDLAWANAQSALRFSGIEQGKAMLFERIAARIVLNIPQGRPLPEKTCAGVPGLWKLGISGDLPIVLLRVDRHASARLAKTLLELHGYLGSRGIKFDLVFIGVYPNEYAGELRLRLQDMIDASAGGDGTVHLLHAYALSQEDEAVLRALALIEIDPRRSLDRQFTTPAAQDIPMKAFTPRQEARGAFAPAEDPLLFANGYGGFNQAGDEYVIRLSPGESTPLPWANILANERFGTLVTENGGGYTWAGNAREHKLTPWANDPVHDPKGELLLIYDEDDLTAWTLTQGPIARGARTQTRHGFGYTVYSSDAEEISASLKVFVDERLPVKYGILTLHNPMRRMRDLGVMYAVEWVLGDKRHPEAIRTSFEGRACFAANLRTAGGNQAYIAIGGEGLSVEHSADREDVLSGGWARDRWEGDGEAYGTGFSALRTRLSLAPGETRKLLLLLGEDDKEAAESLLEMDADGAEERLRAVQALWRQRLGAVQVHTPDRAMDILLNGWLPYQTWSARILGRTGYYQCGGAIGFRDQLQDMLALLHADPARVRAHILLSAARQFRAGDVLHWWHPPMNGVRTRIVDDRLFLPYVAMAYARTTGDADIWEEEIPYLADVPIPEGKRDIYCPMQEGEAAESLYLHCARAIDCALSMGGHGLPLMGGGDWNDGMDHVGDEGGESVWMGMMLLHALRDFIPIAAQHGEGDRAARYAAAADALAAALEAAGWDGEWYRRAYFGDGRGLGSRGGSSRGGEGCAIDLICQAWAAMCDLPHKEEAFASAMALLADRENGLVRLLAPPFERPDGEVGYISNYLPGIRENGGQYTHAGAWLLRAACILKKPEEARELFAMLNPITHGDSPFAMRRYKAEPYVLAGDVYSVGRNAGRGGWTWYTGAAGWLYTAALSDMLGVTRRGDRLFIVPCTDYKEYTVRYTYGSAVYEITVHDGASTPEGILLTDDGAVHKVHVTSP